MHAEFQGKPDDSRKKTKVFPCVKSLRAVMRMAAQRGGTVAISSILSEAQSSITKCPMPPWFKASLAFCARTASVVPSIIKPGCRVGAVDAAAGQGRSFRFGRIVVVRTIKHLVWSVQETLAEKHWCCIGCTRHLSRRLHFVVVGSSLFLFGVAGWVFVFPLVPPLCFELVVE